MTTTYNYVWNDGKLVSQSDGTNKFYFLYSDSDYAPSGFMYNGVPYFYTKNLQGDVTGIVNMGGVLVTSYTYDAWGNVLSVTGTQASTIGAANPIRYRGYYYDAETGLYYLQSRYYNPEWGRFINADMLQQPKTDFVVNCNEVNLYVYGNNSPIVLIDSNGKEASVMDKALAKVIGDIIGQLELGYELRKRFYDVLKVGIYTTKDKKVLNCGCIVVDFTKDWIKKLLKKALDNGIQSGIYSDMAKLACQYFKENYPPKDNYSPREFLFSEDCVAREIKLHAESYLGTPDENGNVYCKSANASEAIRYYAFTTDDRPPTETVNHYMHEHCQNANLCEYSLINGEKRECEYFNYYGGIRACYKSTLADPFYKASLHIRILSYSNLANPSWYTHFDEVNG